MGCSLAYVGFILLLICGVNSQNGQDDFLNVINATDGDFWDKFEVVTQKALEDLAALKKCGEGDEAGKFVCVPYYNCDAQNNTIIEDTGNDISQIIDIRFTTESKCDHYLDKCCKIPEGGLSSDFTRQPTASSSTQSPPRGSSTTSEPITSRPLTSRPATGTSTGGSDDPTMRGPTVNVGSNLCGIRNENGIDFQITGDGDNEAEFGEFPWMIALLEKSTDPNQQVSFCGGSLIAPNVVLTAAHCIIGRSPNTFKIRAGEWDTQTQKERIPYQERDVEQTFIHEAYGNKSLYNDVGLVILRRPLSKVASIGTICLPTQAQNFGSANCIATGWGKDIFGKQGQYSVILKKIELPLVQNGPCQSALRTTRLSANFNLHRSFICAGGEEGVDTCTGDGGSPLVCPDPVNPNRYVQVGIVSWGIGCGENGIPGVYGDVTQFRSWIDQKLRQFGINPESYTVDT